MIKKKQSLKSKLALIALAGLALVAPANAQESKSLNKQPVSQQRTVGLNFAHPFSTFDSRAKLNSSGNELAGKGLDYLGKKGLDKTMINRAVKIAGETYVAGLFAYITHEAGHDGEKTEFTSELRPIKLRPGIVTPKVKSCKLPAMSDKELAAYFSRGLNQNTYNAEKTLKNSILNNKAPGISYLLETGTTAVYSPITTRATGETLDDLIGYSNSLEKRGIKTSKEKIQKGARIANILTLQNWKSVYDTGRFILTGKKADAPLNFKVQNGKFTPPAISCYLGETGNFYNATSFINMSKQNPVSISVGHGRDGSRIGGQLYHQRTPMKNLIISPKIYLNNAQNQFGYSVGTEAEFKIGQKTSLIAMLEYNKNDLISNIKETDGFNVSTGFKLKF